MDASDVCAGAALQQGHWSLNQLFSKKFDESQRRYSTTKKETLALLLTLKHFDVYLNMTAEPVLIYTGHNPIVFINKMKEKNQRLLRWSLILQQYNIQFSHVKGSENVIAYALSRVK